MMKIDFYTRVCMCDTQMWRLDWVIFDDEGDIAAYSERMTCITCGTEAFTPGCGNNEEGF